VFFARVPPPVPYDDLLTLFRQYGEVKDLNLYRRWATAKTSKGCGIVVFSSCSAAKAALEALNGAKPFEGYPGCDMPMVIEYVDASRIKVSVMTAATDSICESVAM
jgi:RNA recognition motif-containing protein